MATKYLNLDTDPEFTANSDERISSQKAIKTALSRKQNTLTAGASIEIADNVISANTYRGKWNSSEIYYPGNIVYYIGLSTNYFLCAQENTNNRPTFNNLSVWVPLDVPNIATFRADESNSDYAIVTRSQVSNNGVTYNDTNYFHTSKNHSPSINMKTGRMKVYGGIEGYYTSAETDEKFQSAETEIKKLTNFSTGIETDKVYKATITSATSIVLPTGMNNSITHNIIIYLSVGNGGSITDFGTNSFYNSEKPVPAAGEFYDLIYIYNPVKDAWVLNAVKINTL